MHVPQAGQPRPGSGPEVGSLSADGSRVWDGYFWHRVSSDPPIVQSGSAAARSQHTEFLLEERRFGFIGVLVATVVGIVLTHVHFNLPLVGPLSSALTQVLVTQLLWFVFSYGMVILILSIGRRGVDVMLLRAMLVAFFHGVAFIAMTPLNQLVESWVYWLTLLLTALAWVVLVGPIFAVWATVANLIWYRSVTSLRPQLWFIASR